MGRNAFAHEAGIHQDGMLKEPRTLLKSCGLRTSCQPSARLSARAALQPGTPSSGAAKRSGIDVSPAELEHVYRAVITMGEHRQAVGDGDLRRIVERLREGEIAADPGGARPETSANADTAI